MILDAAVRLWPEHLLELLAQVDGPQLVKQESGGNDYARKDENDCKPHWYVVAYLFRV